MLGKSELAAPGDGRAPAQAGFGGVGTGKMRPSLPIFWTLGFGERLRDSRVGVLAVRGASGSRFVRSRRGPRQCRLDACASRSRFPSSVDPEPIGRVAANGGFEGPVHVAHDGSRGPRLAVLAGGNFGARLDAPAGKADAIAYAGD